MLVRKEIAHAFDEILGGLFDQVVLVVMALGGWAGYENAVLLLEGWPASEASWSHRMLRT